MIEPEPESEECIHSPEIPEKEDEPLATTGKGSGEADSLPTARPKRPKKKALVLADEQEVELAEWIRSHPEVYTKGLKLYKDSGRKQKLWDDKAREMGMESDLLRTWYESIRTKIGKLTATKSGSAAKEATERDNFLLSNFSFLKEHIARMRGRTAMSLQSQIQSSVYTASSQPVSSLDDSNSELEDSMESNMPTDPDPKTIPPMTKEGKGKRKATRKTTPTSIITQPLNISDDEEAAAIPKKLQHQQVQSGKIQEKIATMLDADQQTAMAQFGSFLGRLGMQIDERLVNGFYRDALDLTINAIEKSRSLPQRQPPLPPPTPRQHFQHPQQPSQQSLTYTPLLSVVPSSSTSMWDTYHPSAESRTAQLVVPPTSTSISQSTPNNSLSPLPLSDISQSLMTPEDPSLRPQW